MLPDTGLSVLGNTEQTFIPTRAPTMNHSKINFQIPDVQMRPSFPAINKTIHKTACLLLSILISQSSSETV